MNTKTPLSSLARPDKWYLGGGNRLLFAPLFPVHLGSPGLWDHAQYYNFTFRPLYTWTLLDSHGEEIDLHLTDTVWTPDVLTRTFRSSIREKTLTVVERTCILPTDVAISEISIRKKAPRRDTYTLTAWTVRESRLALGRSFVRPLVEEGIFSCDKTLTQEGREIRLGIAFAISGARVRHRVLMSEGNVPPPQWSHTPFAENPDAMRSDTAPAKLTVSEGMMFVGFQATVRTSAGSNSRVLIGSAVAPTSVEARSNLSTMLRKKDPVRLSTVAWNDHFSSVPAVSSSDPFIDAAYWYRWYGLRLNTIYGGEGNYEHPAVCEGIGYFRAPISYSAPCHMQENRWMLEPELARGSLLTFIHNQREDGGFRGYIDVNTYRQEMFYHANWGRALLALEALHPLDSFLLTAYEGLKRYAAYFDRERDEEVSGLYDIDNHYETGQEYMRRYTVVNPAADEDHWGEVFRLKGVDVTVYIYELKRALAAVAERLGRTDEADLWHLEADRTRAAVREHMWDPEEGMFFDVDPSSGMRTGVKAATCFYPYFTDIVDRKHLAGFKKHLFSPKEFWSAWPVPSTSMDDPSFSAEPLWKGKRMNCPWNGRVWPMTNSHIMEAMATSALRFEDAVLERRAGEFLLRFIRMMFENDDPKRPNCYEHYNPLTGTPSTYRGVNDYMHSWVNDLILKYIFGLQPGLDSVTIRPLRMGLKKADVKRVMIRGREIDVAINGPTFRVTVDGQMRAEEKLGKPIELRL